MARLIWVPQPPVKGRYQEWWIKEIPKGLSKYFNPVYTIVPGGLVSSNPNSSGHVIFGDVVSALDWETSQFLELIRMKYHKDDYILFGDISFGGIAPQALFYDDLIPEYVRCFGFCHGTSLNEQDYFARYKNRGKFDCELGIMSRMDRVFVASEYHRIKLSSCVRYTYDGWSRPYIANLGALPLPPCSLIPQIKDDRSTLVGILGGYRPQKRDLEIENRLLRLAETSSPLYFEVITGSDWSDYFTKLSQCCACVTFPKEETYGYQVSDALMMGTPVYSLEQFKKFGHSEMIPEVAFAANVTDLLEMLVRRVEGNPDDPYGKNVELLNSDKVQNFYSNLAELMYASNM